jgi:hypothetical protein
MVPKRKEKVEKARIRGGEGEGVRGEEEGVG